MSPDRHVNAPSRTVVVRRETNGIVVAYAAQQHRFEPDRIRTIQA
jgi:hypothetical protein